MCLETILNYADNGKVHENCRYLRDTMGEGKAKAYLKKLKTESAEATGAPCNIVGKHTAPAALETAPVESDPWVGTRDISQIPNAD